MELALRREARAAKVPLSRAAERAIERGLVRRPSADPEDRLLRLDRALRDHMRSTARDMAILQELVVELARALFLRLPDSPGDADALLQAAAAARVERLLDAAAARIAAGSPDHSAVDAAAASSEANGMAHRNGAEVRTFEPSR
ncbi:MAG TPA: hypothetical protein VFH92_11625 [Phenylobacterium sp.]|nr:hypothetical protein [Phenylobacterium sp.]